MGQWIRQHVLRGMRSGCIHPGDHLQICGLRRRLRCSPSTQGFHLPDHDVLPPELASVAAPSALAVLGLRIRLHYWGDDLRDFLELGAATVLLLNCWCRMHHHDSAYSEPDSSSNPSPNAATNAAANPRWANHSPSSKLRSWRSVRVG